MSKEKILNNKIYNDDFSFKNNLLFYTILKTLLQCRLSEYKLINLQKLINFFVINQDIDVLKIKKLLLSSSDIVNFTSATRSNFETLINTLTSQNYEYWVKSLDLAIDLLLIKDQILLEAKNYINNQIKNDICNISDKLSIEYDLSNIEIPYGLRVLCCLMSYDLTDYNHEDNFILSKTTTDFSELSKKIKFLQEKYKIVTTGIYSLIISESVNQSILSDAGSSYESRFQETIYPLIDEIKGHSHDSKIPSVEYDFILTKNNKKIGVSAKRTLRERYKQNFENIEDLDVDYMFLVTLGTDLNEEKLHNILQREKIFVIIAQEIYESKDYFKNSPRVISSKDLTSTKLNEIIL